MMNRFVVIIVCVQFAFCSQDTGTPDGLMADCPGMSRNTTFSEKTLRSLHVLVIHPTPTRDFLGQGETRCPLNRHGAKCAAKLLDLRKGPTQILISGYMDASFSPFVRGLASVNLVRGRNAIIVEIFPILVRTYPVAARITKPLGKLLGEFMAGLADMGLSSDRLELVGGSLGAHVAHFAAIRYKELTGRKPSRISGLDPAGPCFRNMPYEERLNPDSAEKVDVTHTNIDGFGIADTLGHIDFYINGGEYQTAMFSDFILPCFQFCSHVRSALYWVLAFRNPDKFAAVRCGSVADARHGNCYDKPLEINYLGPNTNFSNPGIYYLPTYERFPYYMGEEGLKKRKYNHNDYLLRPAPDVDMII